MSWTGHEEGYLDPTRAQTVPPHAAGLGLLQHPCPVCCPILVPSWGNLGLVELSEALPGSESPSPSNNICGSSPAPPQ